MQRLDGGAPLPAAFRGGVIALGNFDGFHRGHQAVVGRAVARARAEGRPAIVATFDPHPQRFFKPDAPPFLLTAIDQRAALFGAAGADAVLVIGFDRALASLSPEQFVERLAGPYGAAAVVTGADFTFGRGKGGDPATLAALGAARGMAVETVPHLADAGGPISSSRIRAALSAGDCAEAARLLTRPFAVRGPVIHGDKLGRAIGYPTANLDLGAYQRPRYGVYAVRGRLADGRVLDGAANLGVRPHFEPPKELLEPYFFDFTEDLYGQAIEVELIHFLRPETKFDGLAALIAQIERDCADARAVLATR
jgi:riboflavin kinase/FMN adenylyltransferase